jgi:L-lysine 6-transaminase
MINIKKSIGSLLYCGNRYILDFHGGYGSNPLGWNHRKLTKKMSSIDISYFVNKPANSDFQTKQYINFQKNFKTILPNNYPHLFFIDGGALAVENAIKVAMDWKYQKNKKYLEISTNEFNKFSDIEKKKFFNNVKPKSELQIMHLENSFHGRSGYTLSLTNTDNNKIKRFSKFNWPRIPISKEYIMLNHIKNFFNVNNNIAGFIIEPIQCEGGDHYFSKDFLLNIQKLCNDYDILFIIDEVQTGFFTTGQTWCFQHYNLQPDIVSFGKKSQQCGIFANEKISEFTDNCFDTPGRINSTWGGNLVDMIRSNIILDIIKDDNLQQNALDRGNQWYNEMIQLNLKNISNIRNLGLIMAFDCPNRDNVLKNLEKEGLLTLYCGKNTIRLRPNLAVSEYEITNCVNIIKKVFEN